MGHQIGHNKIYVGQRTNLSIQIKYHFDLDTIADMHNPIFSFRCLMLACTLVISHPVSSFMKCPTEHADAAQAYITDHPPGLIIQAHYNCLTIGLSCEYKSYIFFVGKFSKKFFIGVKIIIFIINISVQY